MPDEDIKLLGTLVDFHDDKKEKWQSWSATVDCRASATDLNGFGSIEATGYGATKEEALKDLRAIVDRLINA